MRRTLYKYGLPLAGIVGALAAWQIGLMWSGLNPKLFPPPTTIFATLLRLMTPPPDGGMPIMLGNVFSSLMRITVSMFIAVILGPMIGIAMGTNRIVHGAVAPIVNALLPIPSYAYIPIILLWFGQGSVTIVTATAVAAMLPLIYTTSAGTRTIDKRMVFVLKSFGASRAQVLMKVVLPAAVAAIAAGLRQSFANGWRTLIGGEFIAAPATGIGYLMFYARDFLAVDVMFACVLVLSFFGAMCLYVLVGWVENHTLRKWGMMREDHAGQ